MPTTVAGCAAPDGSDSGSTTVSTMRTNAFKLFLFGARNAGRRSSRTEYAASRKVPGVFQSRRFSKPGVFQSRLFKSAKRALIPQSRSSPCFAIRVPWSKWVSQPRMATSTNGETTTTTVMSARSDNLCLLTVWFLALVVTFYAPRTSLSIQKPTVSPVIDTGGFDCEGCVQLLLVLK